MFPFFRLWFGLLARCFRSHHTLVWENLALRQQLTVLKRKHRRTKVSRPGQTLLGARAPVLVRLEEFSHHRHSRNCGALASCRISALLELDLEGEKTGRQKKTVEGNPESDLPDGGRKPNLGCSPHPRRTAHAGLRRIRAKHFPLDERAPSDPELAQRWQAFVRNHRDAIAAMDFFTVPTVTFQLLYCFFIISHERRQILHVNVTRHPTGTWIAQQLREAFPYESAPGFLLFDHD
jgi:hypothetical protein